MPAMRSESFFGDRIVSCFAERPENFDALIRETVALRPHAEALVHNGVRLTYAEFDAQLDAVAAALESRGIQAGDRVGILCDNSIEALVALFGAIRCGAVAVPMGTRQQTAELDYVLNDAGIAALVFDAALAGRLPDQSATPSLRHRFAVGEATGVAAEPFAALTGTAKFPRRTIDAAQPAIIMYTSGTTGRPKGAVLPHLAMVHTAMHFVQCLGHVGSSRALLTIPASHISGLGAVVMAMLRAGGCVVIDDGFRASSFLSRMAAERISFTVLVPAMYKLCLLEPGLDQFDLGHWKIGLFGGAIMPPATIAELARRLPNLQLINAYGATETTSPATIMPPGRIAEAPDSIGHAVPCGDIKIMDDQGREVPQGEAGEIWIGGPMIASRYWNNPKATEESFTAGYWHSGDIGSVDAAGFVRIFDRKKDMINRGGYKIYSAEVENVLARHPNVVETVVVGRPDSVLGERVHAFVCTKHPNISDSELAAHCAAELSDYKVPESWTVSTDPLPRNANGKFEKRALAEKAAALPGR
jgi:O-succinylbenzoic acid--CoA ligase